MTADHGPRQDAARLFSTDGVTVALHDLGGQGPPLLLCHATGFHGPIWAPVAAELAADAHCWALDFRGHGDSALPASDSLGWHRMADDVRAAAARLKGEALFGVGHSMGGTALILAEQAVPGLFAALWCFEPIVLPTSPTAAGSSAPNGPPVPRPNPMAASARRRKAVFPDRATAMANYAAKPPLDGFDPRALEAYVEHGFKDLAEGGVELKCAPETEASVFEGGIHHQAFSGLGDVLCPATIVASGDGRPPSVAAMAVADALPKGRFEQLRALSHFGPMEDPEAIAHSIRTSFFSRSPDA